MQAITRALLLVGALASSPLRAAAAPDYPPAPRGPVIDDYFGTKVPDPYRWLEDLDSAPTQAWIDAESRLSAQFLGALPSRDAFRKRLDELWNYSREAVPHRAGSRYFYTHNDGLQNQPVLMVRDGENTAPRVLLDPNTLSAGGTVAMSSFVPSPDGRWVVYGTARSGSDWNEYRVRDAATGADSAEVLTRIKFSDASWTRDGRGFFYSRYPDAPAASDDKPAAVFDDLSGQALYYHRVGTPQREDLRIFAIPEHPKWFVAGRVSDSGRYLFISAVEGSNDDNRLWVVELGDPKAPKVTATPRLLIDDFDASQVPIGDAGGKILLLTDRDAPRRRVAAMDLSHPEPKHWVTLVPESADTLTDALLANGQLIVSAMHDASTRLLRYTTAGKPLPPIELPRLGSVAPGALSGDPEQPELFYAYTSCTKPATIYGVDLASGRQRVFHQPELRFDPAQYTTEQVFYRSLDGTRIPMFISYRRGFERNGAAPAFLHGYGGFDIPKVPDFDPSALAWMERGGVYAVANLRGGGEYGQQWHEAGTRDRKQNVFDDFYAAGRYLVEQKYTQAPKLAIWGRSNGGLLVGASINQHPEFWGAAVATVGVMDMLRFHRFTVGYAWTSDYGSSDSKEGFDVLIRYSPLHTVRPGTHYPPTLITTGDHDDRVFPAHSFKYAAALQAAQAGDAPILIRIDRDAGHGGGKPVAKLLDEEADKLAFMWHYTAGN